MIHLFLISVLYLSCLLPAKLFAQEKDYQWWNGVHQWDGITHWQDYLTMSPGFTGPNALPVPQVQTGRLATEARVEMGLHSYFSPGDKTQSLSARLYYPFGSMIAIQIYGVPFEYYKTDTATRDRRAARDRDGEGPAEGDLYFSTLIQLLRDHKKIPDLVLELTGKTASGNNFDNARFTDSPGYFFDLGFGKEYTMTNKARKIAWFGMFGFYSWQTEDREYRQNDALLYGAGTALRLGNTTISATLAGYAGYLNNGDKPLVSRLKWERGSHKLKTRLEYQTGWRDFAKHSLSFVFIYQFPGQ